jgi:NADPH-dependent 2,4-dienoyl-CoA reductase/sulfur reductase-like enzyme
MKQTDVLVVGGSTGGLSAAVSARRNYADKQITLVRRQEKVLLPCGISYIFETFSAVEKDLIPADAILSNNKVKSVIDEVSELDREKKLVRTVKGEAIGYEKLILAIGSSSVIPPISGTDLENVFVAEKDADYLNNMLKAIKASKRFVIIGGGFVGVEFADDLSKRDVDITVVEMLPHCLQLSFDDEFCEKAEEKLKERGVKILLNNTAQEIGEEKKAEYVKLRTGEKLDADVVMLGIGTRPNIEMAQQAGLKIGDTRAIWVDDFQRTSDKDIFAVGDCAEKRFLLTGKPVPMLLSSIAGREGKIAGANLFELRQKNNGTVVPFATMIGDVSFGVAGFTERTARDAGINFIEVTFTGADKHPGTMPDTKEIYLKLLFSKSGEIIGGEAWGGMSIGELINHIATLVERRMRVDDLIKLQAGVHPWLTGSPVTYPISNAAEMAIGEFRRSF